MFVLLDRAAARELSMKGAYSLIGNRDIFAQLSAGASGLCAGEGFLRFGAIIPRGE